MCGRRVCEGWTWGWPGRAGPSGDWAEGPASLSCARSPAAFFAWLAPRALSPRRLTLPALLLPTAPVTRPPAPQLGERPLAAREGTEKAFRVVAAGAAPGEWGATPASAAGAGGGFAFGGAGRAAHAGRARARGRHWWRGSSRARAGRYRGGSGPAAGPPARESKRGVGERPRKQRARGHAPPTSERSLSSSLSLPGRGRVCVCAGARACACATEQR